MFYPKHLTKAFCLTLLLAALIVFTPQLFAYNSDYEEGNTTLYLGFGIGATTVNSKVYSGASIGLDRAGDPSLWNNPKNWELSGGSIGLKFEYLLTGSLAITSRLSYEWMKYEVKWPLNHALYDIKTAIKLKYLTIPLGARYYFDFILLGAGLNYSINLSSKTEMKIGPDKETTSRGANNVVGAFIDAGVHFNISNFGKIQIFIRHSQDFNDFYDNSNYYITEMNKTETTLNFAYGIKL